MTTRREITETVDDRSNTRKAGLIRVWGAVTLTIAITSDPPQFIKCEFGHERLVPNTLEDLRTAERRIHAFNQKTVTARVEEYRQLVEEVLE